MKFIKTDIADVVIIQPKIYRDDRGYFMETFRQDKLEEYLSYGVNFIQDNESKSSKYVLRGVHYQLPPYAQTKLVRVIQGKILDVAVDIRESSKTFRKYISIELSSENRKQLLIPKGFAHGFVTLSDEAIISYKVDNLYEPKFDRGIAFDDIELNIDWRVDKKDIILSPKDKKLPNLQKAEIFE